MLSSYGFIVLYLYMMSVSSASDLQCSTTESTLVLAGAVPTVAATGVREEVEDEDEEAEAEVGAPSSEVANNEAKVLVRIN